MSGGRADQGTQPRILIHRNLGPNSYSPNSVTLGRHLTYKNLGFLLKGTGACVLVDEAASCLSGGQDHVWWCVLGCL